MVNKQGDEPAATGGPRERSRVSRGLRGIAGASKLEGRVEALERELAEYRTSHVRLAELIDLVQELLLPVAQQDRDKIAQLLQRYTDELEA